jgi:putative transposase
MLVVLCFGAVPQCSAGRSESQSVKAPAAPEQGYDANKKIKGRKRHIAVDTDGRLLAMNLTAADVADSLARRWCSMR